MITFLISKNRDVISTFCKILSITEYFTFNNYQDCIDELDKGVTPDLIFSETDLPGMSFRNFATILNNHNNSSNSYIIGLSESIPHEAKKLASDLKLTDLLTLPIDPETIKLKIQFIENYKDQLQEIAGEEKDFNQYKLPVIKRVFDIIAASMALIILSPILILVALLIRIDSKGPIFYLSKRVGTGYKVFNLIKFRTMEVDADKKLKDLEHLNEYGNNKSENYSTIQMDGNESSEELFNDQLIKCSKCNNTIHNIIEGKIWDDSFICKNCLESSENIESDNTFYKIKNDPRITRIGRILRNTSIDEVPQLINVLKGNMSLVGNRPLPLYEAEKLTTDDLVLRFLAPAGLTGLWQITKRGKSDMSTEERVCLDNQYASNNSFLMDFKIILKTFPALIQSEDV
ncbi:sugar transferase [Flexithrix dorotheae]|uniref:sugar transferase n=1 Tax=Flexithrix dorotheae TaxID=70993 RepID=UPI000371D925|nr:sugar transferase [Flexithrix dorotheae]